MKNIPDTDGEAVMEVIPGTRFETLRHPDAKPPVPVGSYVAIVFRVDGYTRDCDGTYLAKLSNVSKWNGRIEESGWSQTGIGIGGDSSLDVLLENPEELKKLCNDHDD